MNTPDHGGATIARPRVEALGTLAFVAFGTATLLVQLGYCFEDLDQQQYLLLGYRFIYEDFLPDDWFTWHTSHYHYSYAWIVYGLHAVAGEGGFAIAMFTAHLATLASLCYAMSALARAVGLGPGGAVGAVLLFGFVRSDGIGGATLNHGQLLPADMALPFLLLAFADWLRGRARTAGIWLGCSGLLHANFAVLGPLVLFPLEWLRCAREGSRRPLFEMTVGYLVPALPSLVLIAQSFLATDAAPEAIDIVLRERSPHHYDISVMGADDFWWPVVLLFAGLPAWLDPRHPARRGPPLLLMGSLTAALLLSVLGSLLQMTPVIRLFIWRLSVPLLVLLALVAGDSLVRSVKRHDVHAVVLQLGALAAAATFAREDLPEVSSWFGTNALFPLPALVPLVIGAAALTFESGRYRVAVPFASLLAVLWAGLIAWVPLTVTYRDDTEYTAKVRRPAGEEIRIAPQKNELYSWIRDNTARDAKFLIPPGLLDFRLGARRPVYVDWKCIPMKGDEALEWRRRMLEVIGTEELESRGYDLRRSAKKLYRQRPLGELVAIARKHGLDYILAKNRGAKAEGLGAKKLVRTRRWRLYRVMSKEEVRKFVEESYRSKRKAGHDKRGSSTRD